MKELEYLNAVCEKVILTKGGFCFRLRKQYYQFLYKEGKKVTEFHGKTTFVCMKA